MNFIRRRRRNIKSASAEDAKAVADKEDMMMPARSDGKNSQKQAQTKNTIHKKGKTMPTHTTTNDENKYTPGTHTNNKNNRIPHQYQKNEVVVEQYITCNSGETPHLMGLMNHQHTTVEDTDAPLQFSSTTSAAAAAVDINEEEEQCLDSDQQVMRCNKKHPSFHQEEEDDDDDNQDSEIMARDVEDAQSDTSSIKTEATVQNDLEYMANHPSSFFCATTPTTTSLCKTTNVNVQHVPAPPVTTKTQHNNTLPSNSHITCNVTSSPLTTPISMSRQRRRAHQQQQETETTQHYFCRQSYSSREKLQMRRSSNTPNKTTAAVSNHSSTTKFGRRQSSESVNTETPQQDQWYPHVMAMSGGTHLMDDNYYCSAYDDDDDDNFYGAHHQGATRSSSSAPPPIAVNSSSCSYDGV
uniref:Uncharacterized protein n=1 Tax=Leptocylindrus danicus TaxID=163516 RepID=A0A7S2KRI2_9STRA|mmetsp:Transcript_25173/g.37637  ORF Transcript_25173/g.37637 Transcript_25173/m.37637 type:complete len:411 (+) Transcript_25173:303-1535(+)|eukprot:CAMPEP_0116009246 /NCGR_PEP_ID=MMETSP0321-20121206/3323_1 /TAXON_ID=163516 /ORGANISM="Leptocylindrus danicus var. danicus, Strain B650" /LENGTH=410 /DNA_ID=CAMNT_0003478181 /DNA_START=290 /DNA_END=1522 /DNA_ORIENTATION=-